MLHSELVFDTSYTTKNFSSSPVTISNMLGDIFEYCVIFWCDVASGDSIMDVTFNSDTTANYRNYEMKGLSTTASAATGDADTAIELQNLLGTANPNLMIMHITGSSGDERYIESMYAADGAIVKQSSYWKNTASEITSMTFTAASSVTCDARIIIYRYPKISSQGRWQLMKTETVSSQDISTSGTPIDFTGLDLDSHKEYLVTWNNLTSSNLRQEIRINGDTGSNYTQQGLRNNGGTLDADNRTQTFFYTGVANTASASEYGYFHIQGDSSVKRLAKISYGAAPSSTGYEQTEYAGWWNNTASNLSSLRFFNDNTATVSGTWKLYRAKNPYTTADLLPFQTIKVIDVSGDYSSGTTISGLTLDDYKLVKIEFEGEISSGSSTIQIQFNSDTGSNYASERLQGSTTTASAAFSTNTQIFLSTVNTTGPSKGVFYLYPKSGDNRPGLTIRATADNLVRYQSEWWLNSADEITSIKTFCGSSTSMTGQIKISVLK